MQVDHVYPHPARLVVAMAAPAAADNMKAFPPPEQSQVRYVIDLMAGTLMAVDPNAPQVERFIMLGGEPRLLRCNSKLPLVVYVPDGVEVRYRLWRADPQATPAQEG
jgi:hypothetical protein